MDEAGSLAEWVAAIAAVGAVIAAVVAAGHTSGLLRREASRDEKSAEREASSQARAVAVWATMRMTSESKHIGLVITNESAVPVYDVEVTGTYREKAFLPLKLEVLPPGRMWVRQDFQNAFGWDYAVDRSSIADEVRPLTVGYRWRIDSIAFRDAAGVRWSRDAGGALSRLP